MWPLIINNTLVVPSIDCCFIKPFRMTLGRVQLEKYPRFLSLILLEVNKVSYYIYLLAHSLMMSVKILTLSSIWHQLWICWSTRGGSKNSILGNVFFLAYCPAQLNLHYLSVTSWILCLEIGLVNIVFSQLRTRPHLVGFNIKYWDRDSKENHTKDYPDTPKIYPRYFFE